MAGPGPGRELSHQALCVNVCVCVCVCVCDDRGVWGEASEALHSLGHLTRGYFMMGSDGYYFYGVPFFKIYIFILNANAHYTQLVLLSHLCLLSLRGALLYTFFPLHPLHPVCLCLQKK